jgi:hypothetical protein
MISNTQKFGTIRREFSWRHGNPATDIDLDGEPIQHNYSVIVRVKNCPVIRESESGHIKHINTKNAPQAIIMNHGATDYGYGEWKQIKSKEGRYITDKQNPENSGIVHVFYRCIVYTVLRNRVYAKSIIKATMPEIMKKRNTRNVLFEKSN